MWESRSHKELSYPVKAELILNSVLACMDVSDGISVRRVSPIVWLCIKQQDFGGFQKDVKISIPHFLHFSTEYAYTYLRFLKADQPYISDENDEVE